MTGRQLLASDIWAHLDRTTTLADNVTLNTAGGGGKGTYVELSASLPNVVYAWVISLHNPSVAGMLYVDLARGGAGSEVIFITDLPIGDTQNQVSFFIPRYSGAGVRLSARVGNAAGHTVEITVIGVGP
jgi:hypothetical protein